MNDFEQTCGWHSYTLVAVVCRTDIAAPVCHSATFRFGKTNMLAVQIRLDFPLQGMGLEKASGSN